jgi:hypothetical protein
MTKLMAIGQSNYWTSDEIHNEVKLNPGDIGEGMISLKELRDVSAVK